jgi:ribosomal-protein-alanine N-acetyltransferase
VIRDFTPADAAPVAALDTALFDGNAWSQAAWAREAGEAAPDRRYLVLEVDGAVAGYAGIMRAGSDADILTVAVVPRHRAQGHGAALVEHLLRIAEGWRCLAVFLEVEQSNAAALHLYRSAGFAEVGIRRHYYGTDRHAITMLRRLREPLGSLPLGGDAR